MKMSKDFQRRPDLDNAFNDMHGVKPIVSMQFIDTEKYKVKLDVGGKSAVITEKMVRGLTESVTLEIDGQTIHCKSVIEAEKKAAEHLKGKK